jgi:rubrerythrin
MTVLTPTKDQGAQVRPLPAVYAEPDAFMTDDALDRFLPDVGVNGPFVADLLSAMVTHERCGRHLYRSVEGRTHNPALRARYREFGEQTERHVRILEDLIESLGGNGCYVSPMARAVQGMDTKLLESTFALAGSVDVMTQEMAMLDAVVLAETIDHANWSTLSQLTDSLPAGDARDRFEAAVREVEEQEDDHIEWATSMRHRMVVLQAEHRTMATAAAKAEEMVERVRGWFDGE